VVQRCLSTRLRRSSSDRTSKENDMDKHRKSLISAPRLRGMSEKNLKDDDRDCIPGSEYPGNCYPARTDRSKLDLSLCGGRRGSK